MKDKVTILPNSLDLYIVDPIYGEDGEPIREFQLVPIVGWCVEASLDQETGKFSSVAYPISSEITNEDDLAIFDNRTKQWSCIGGSGSGEKSLIEFLNDGNLRSS